MKTAGLHVLGVTLSVTLCLGAAHAVTVTPAEVVEARRWVAAKFAGTPDVARPQEAGLTVLANNGVVQTNARGGRPLKIVRTEYAHGLYCHAVSKVAVRLPGAGKTFTAVAGVDSNDQTSGARGSVVFSVALGGKEAFRSGVMREGMAGEAVRVELGGVTEFMLDVGDAGDGIACDQADWADAKVTLADGREVRLGDLPILSQKTPYTLDPPFSFVYDGRPSAEVLKGWAVTRAERRLDEQRTERTVTYTDAKTGLIVRCVAIEYQDFPTVEWTVYFKNTGTADSPILSNIQALDSRFERNSSGEFTLHHHTGTVVSRVDYGPHASELKPGSSTRFAPSHGRPCAEAFPYFNIEWAGEGVIAVVGWPGKWAAEFARDNAGGLRVTAGQELTHFKLLPGEEVRSPLIVLQFWKGDRVRSQNIWRRWMFAHNVPRRSGKLPPPMLPMVTGNHYPGLLCNEADEILFIDRYLQNGVRIDHWWMDAGWYVNKGDWTSTGTWEIDRKRFPNGLRKVSDHARSKGVETIVWFEPERVTAGSWLADNHPEWVLGGKAGGLLNLGNKDAWTWAVGRFDKIITDEGIDWYRQDFNMDPLPHWRGNDAADRQGITEIHHIEGYLAFWDELVRRHPGLMIDSCASGGHRNDLETMRRSVPLLRSDYIFDPIGEQGHTYGIASWLPYWGTGFIAFDPYIVRSCYGLDLTVGADARRKDIDWPLLKKLTDEWRRLAPNFYGDYYPLTKYSLDPDAWIAWQFDRPEAGEGMIQAFRRSDSVYESARLKLSGLDADARYTVTDVDENTPTEITGRELTEKGLLVRIGARPGAAIVTYKRVGRP